MEEGARPSGKNNSRRSRRIAKNPEEQKKNLRKGPTDTKVVLIKEEEFNLLNQPCSNSQSVNVTPPDHCSDFPSLGNSIAKDSIPPFRSPWGARKIQDPFPSLGTPLRGFTTEGSRGSQPSFTIVATNSSIKVDAPYTATSAKVKKSKRPILLDFSSFIESKGKGIQRKSTTAQVKHRSARQGLHLGGNNLDSSMPVRSRGKFRERPKKRLSRLKTEIIKDRILKSFARGKSNNSNEIDCIDLKNEVKLYIGNMKEEKEKSKSVERNSCKPIANTSCNAAQIDSNTFPAIHFSSKFRSYCENAVTPDLNKTVKELVQSLVQLQDRAFARDPVRARAHKRFVTGLREASKYLKLKRTKLLILAPDLEASTPDGALTSCVRELKECAKAINIPCVYALDRRKLGYCSLRKAPVSAFAVLSYEGLEAQFQAVMSALSLASEMFSNAQLKRDSFPDTPEAVSKVLEKLTVDTNKDNYDLSGDDNR